MDTCLQFFMGTYTPKGELSIIPYSKFAKPLSHLFGSWCSCKDSQFGPSPHIEWPRMAMSSGSQLPATPPPGDLIISSDPHRYLHSPVRSHIQIQSEQESKHIFTLWRKEPPPFLLPLDPWLPAIFGFPGLWQHCPFAASASTLWRLTQTGQWTWL